MLKCSLDRLKYLDDSYNGSGQFNYDVLGNIKSNGVFNFTYNLAGQMTRADAGSLHNTYVYDGNGKRVKATESSGVNYSMYGQNGKLMYRSTGGKHIDYIYLGGKLVAKQEIKQNGSLAQQGSGINRTHYKPFGETIEQPKDDAGYTGHKFDTDLGLSYMQARYYDPVIGRFYSNDPIGFRDVHSFNRYAYANNNPFRFTDPSGLSPEENDPDFVFDDDDEVATAFANAFGHDTVEEGDKAAEEFREDVVESLNSIVEKVIDADKATTASVLLTLGTLSPCSAACGYAALAIDSKVAFDKYQKGDTNGAILSLLPGALGEVTSKAIKANNLLKPELSGVSMSLGTTAVILNETNQK